MSVIIRLQNLPMSANASNIRRFFGGLTIPEGGVHIVGGTDGDAFIAFATDEDARKAMLLDRQSINGASVRLFLSSKTEMQTIIESARTSALFAAPPMVPQPVVSQKSEAMQALDVTAPTLPASFSSYRNGIADETARGRPDNTSVYKRGPVVENMAPHDSTQHASSTDYLDVLVDSHNNRMRRLDPRRPDSLGGFQDQHTERYESSRAYSKPDYYGGIGREPVSTEPRLQKPYGSIASDSSFDRRLPDDPYFDSRSRDTIPSDPRGPHPGSRYGRMNETPNPVHDFRASPNSGSRFPTDNLGRNFNTGPVDDNYISSRGYAGSRRPPNRHDTDTSFPSSRALDERDFSVRPPWLNQDAPAVGHKRSFEGDREDYSSRKRPAQTNFKSYGNELSGETEFVVRASLPPAEFNVKSIFDLMRGAHIVPKWGIRIEEDSLHRPTGYVFIMLTDGASFDKALAYSGRTYRGRPVRIVPSSQAEFYSVTDNTFRTKCPPEIAKKLPPNDQSSNPPHYADGCLEIAQLPPDCTKAEIARFLGAPGLSPDNITIARFAQSDKSAPEGSRSVRALVNLPSAKDLQILLSANPQPLRSDGSMPPVRLTPISRLQMHSYSAWRIPNEQRSDVPDQKNPSVVASSPEGSKKAPGTQLTCAFLSGLSRYHKSAEVLGYFPSVLIPGNGIHMVSPDNTSAYIDFISEKSCRRGIADITAMDSKARQSNPSVRIEPMTRAELEKLAPSYKADDSYSADRPSRPPKDIRGHWDPRSAQHEGSQGGYRRRSPVPPQYEDFYYDRSAQGPPVDAYSGPGRRPRPPMAVPRQDDSIPADYLLPHPMSQSVPVSSRQAGLDYSTVFIGNLSPSVNVDVLADIMRDYFFIPGSIRVLRDVQGQPVGEALVDFASNYDADRAIHELNGFRIAGRPMVLRFDRRM